jgi:hypothetical protein
MSELCDKRSNLLQTKKFYCNSLLMDQNYKFRLTGAMTFSQTEFDR